MMKYACYSYMKKKGDYYTKKTALLLDVPV